MDTGDSRGAHRPDTDTHGGEYRMSDPHAPPTEDATDPAPRVLQLTEPISAREAEERLLDVARLEEIGVRAVAHYLAIMEERQLHQDLGHPTISSYARCRLGFSPTRTSRLVATGRALRELLLIDAAFRQGKLAWRRVLELIRVATPETEEEWLAEAVGTSWRSFMHGIRGRKRGDTPRSQRHGLSPTTFTLSARLSTTQHTVVVRALEKIQALQGQELDLGEGLVALASLALGLRPDGSVPGMERVQEPLFHIVIQQQGHELVLPTEEGPITITPQELAAACGGSSLVALRELTADARDNQPLPPGVVDRPTPDRMRQEVLVRDGRCCIHCGRRQDLWVHHMIWRSRGGSTTPANLVTLCDRCHGMVHDGLLRVDGHAPDHVRFTDRTGLATDRPGERPGMLVQVPPSRGAPGPSHLREIPPEVDTGWWQRHAHCMVWNVRRGAFKHTPRFPRPESSPSPVIHPDPADSSPRLDQLIGQESVRRRLQVAIAAARDLDRAPPHCLLTGGPGLGKTTLARALATEMRTRARMVSAATVKDPGLLVGLLCGIRPGDVIFVDEVHALPRKVTETLYEAMECGSLSLTVVDEVTTRSIQLRLPPFTVVGATTAPERLPVPLRSRFGLRLHLQPYPVTELAALVARAATRDCVTVTPCGAAAIARASRGSPREALSLFERCRDEIQAAGELSLDAPGVMGALASLGTDADGLDKVDQSILEILRSHEEPVGVWRLAALAGISVREYLEHHEPHLRHLHLVRITARGRVATEPALVRPPPVSASTSR